MGVNIKVGGKVYNGIETISVKNENDVLYDFLLQGAQPVRPAAESDVNFYDYDGTIVASYTAADFELLSEMPSNPAHAGLVAQGWNWALLAAKTYVAHYGKLNIGQMYTTTSGKTEYDVIVDEYRGMSLGLGLMGISIDWGDGVTDTLGGHTYSVAGKYTIKIEETDLTKVRPSEIRENIIAMRIANGVYVVPLCTMCYDLQAISIPQSVTSFEGTAFDSCVSLKHITIPQNITQISEGAFQYSGINSVSIPNGVTLIDSYAFSNCLLLRKLILPTSIRTINEYAVSACDSIRELYLPHGLSFIGESAFDECEGVVKLIIPASVTTIKGYAFSSFRWINQMTVLATTPPDLENEYGIPTGISTIYIPNGTLTAYKNALNWSYYEDKFVELPA